MTEENLAAQDDYPETPGAADWRTALGQWRRTNPKTMPDELRQLREEFVRRFPKERLKDLTLEEYGVGTGSNDSFSYWLEYKTRPLGHMGGYATKHGVWWNKKEGRWRWDKFYKSAEDALAHITGGLNKLVELTEQGRFNELDVFAAARLGPSRGLRCKPLSLYFPDQFLPIFQTEHLANFLKVFGAEPQGEVIARNRQLLLLLRGFPAFKDFDTHGMMRFLYDSYPQKKAAEKGDGDEVPEPGPELPPDLPRQLRRLMDSTARTRNVLLYGPPGTGKTWVVNHFTNYFLLHHNVSPEAADAYWRAKDTDEGKVLRAQVREETTAASEQTSFWWITANEKIWSWKTLFEKGAEVFWKQRRRIAKNFEQVKPGDFVFGYFSQPYMQVVALARVREGLGLYASEEDGEPAEGFVIEPAAELHHPLSYRTIIENEILKRSEPIRNRAQGTLFRLTPEEARELSGLLNKEGNNVTLPTTARGDYAEFVTFHQSFAYEEFVEGLKPVASDDSEPDGASTEVAHDVSYKVLPGVFRRVCGRAEAAWRAHGAEAPKYLLVVDEINRANIAKVLGELITLVEDDKRLGMPNEVTVTLPVSGERFGVPPNLYVLGTMNTADRSIALLDLALRRRFTFVEMMPDAAALAGARVGGVSLSALLERLNERVSVLLDRDHQIGHSYLLNLKDEADLRFAWYARVVPLLQEYFYNDYERLKMVIGGEFVRPVEVSPATKKALGDLDPERTPHRIAELDGEELLSALRRLAGDARGGVEEDSAAEEGA